MRNVDELGSQKACGGSRISSPVRITVSSSSADDKLRRATWVSCRRRRVRSLRSSEERITSSLEVLLSQGFVDSTTFVFLFLFCFPR